MTHSANWGRIPQELRERPQWAIASPCTCGTATSDHDDACHFKAPLCVSAHGFHPAKSNDPTTWLTFLQAAQAADAYGYAIGYMLSKEDPYTCIDLDVKDASTHPDDPELWTDPDDWVRFKEIHRQASSYSELSRSGKGMHIWLRGKIGAGRKKDGVEVYSQERFIITTGNEIGRSEIVDRQEWILRLMDGMVGASSKRIPLVELPETETDDQVVDRLRKSEAVVTKFLDLVNGHWQQHGFPSQSEADLALMSYFCFYSKSNEQCRRLFRMSELGKRKKAIKNNKYVNWTLEVIRSRQDREGLASKEQAEAVDFTELIAKVNAVSEQAMTRPTPMHVGGVADDKVGLPPASVALTLAAPVSAAAVTAGESGIPWPPGMAGAMARFVYNSAPRPVKEVGIVAALGLLAGILGKAFFIPQSGLNLYIILVARSAIGKEALHSGISALVTDASKRSPAIATFVDLADFASGQALTKACAANQSFVNVSGEWGHKLKRLAQEDGRDGAMASLRQVMTNLYQKSGPQSMVGGITYSNRDNNIASVSGVAYSMIGETTPGTFYEALTEEMMADGFLSRFTVIAYDGDRPGLNEAPVVVPDKILSDSLSDLAQYCLAMNGRYTPQPVGRTDEAAVMMGTFERECDAIINSTKEESRRQMWNRASLKVMRIAAILAASTDWLKPVVTKEHVEWALLVVRRDIEMMQTRIASGDVGTGDDSRERKMISMLKEYVQKGVSKGYKVPDEMAFAGIVPHNFILQKLGKLNVFKRHRLGGTNAIAQSIKSLIDSGYLATVDKKSSIEQYRFHGLCYRILSPAMDYDVDVENKK